MLQNRVRPNKALEKKVFFPELDASMFSDGIVDKGVSRAMKSSLIRFELQKLQKSRNYKPNPFTSFNGSVGYNELIFVDLENVPEKEKIVAISSNNPQNSIRLFIQETLQEIGTLRWMPESHSADLAETLKIDLARRCLHIQMLIDDNLTSVNHRLVFIRTLKLIRGLIREVIESIRKKANRICNGVFQHLSNSDRLSSLFRTQLLRKINTKALVEQAYYEFMHSTDNQDGNQISSSEILREEVDSIRETIDKMYSSSTKLKMPSSFAHEVSGTMRHISEKRNWKLEQSKVILESTKYDSHKLHGKQILDDLKLLSHSGKTIESRYNAVVPIDEYEVLAVDSLDYGIDSIMKSDAIHATDDPILSAHTQKPSYNISEYIRIPKDVPTPVCYLPPEFRNISKYKWTHDQIELESIVKTDYSYQIGDIDNMRPFRSSFSKRTPANLISTSIPILSDEFAVTGIEKLGVTSDEILSSYKELEDLYLEVCKFSKAEIFKVDEDEDCVVACPASGIDIETSGTYTTPLPTEIDSGAQQVIASKPKVLMLTVTDHIVSPSSFIKSRKNAMSKVQSSKYNYPFNYGGYIPSGETIVAKLNPTDMSDYDRFLSTTFCDFIPKILFEKKRVSERKQRALEEEINKVAASKDRKNKRVLEKAQLTKNMFVHAEGTWNSAVLEYLGNDRNFKDLEVSMPNMLAESFPSNGDYENELKQIWELLFTPVEHQIEMAVKYGHHSILPARRMAMVKDLKAATLLIKAREESLVQISNFELHAYQVIKEENGEWTKQALVREKLLKYLHECDDAVEKICFRFEKEYGDKILYKGDIYSNKMKHDYLDILQNLEKKL